MAKTKKKAGKIVGTIILILLAVLVIGFSIFLYFHGNTKPYEVPQEVSAAIQAQNVVKKQEGNVRVMSSNLLVSYPGWHSKASREKGIPNARPRAKMYYELLDTYKPDVVGLQEMCDMWFNCLLRHNGPYKIVHPVKTALTVQLTSLMYNTETTKLVESGQFKYSVGDNGRLRLLIWSLFEDIATGKQYIVTSTHLSVPDKGESHREDMKVQVKELIDFSNQMKEKYNVPIYHTGDFNAINNSENWKELFPGRTQEDYDKMIAKMQEEKPEMTYEECMAKIESDNKIRNADFIYEELNSNFPDTVNTAKRTCFAEGTTATTPVYDHIFQNGDSEIAEFVSISSDAMHKMSDHFSIFVDAKLA